MPAVPAMPAVALDDGAREGDSVLPGLHRWPGSVVGSNAPSKGCGHNIQCPAINCHCGTGSRGGTSQRETHAGYQKLETGRFGNAPAHWRPQTVSLAATSSRPA